MLDRHEYSHGYRLCYQDRCMRLCYSADMAHMFSYQQYGYKRLCQYITAMLYANTCSMLHVAPKVIPGWFAMYSSGSPIVPVCSYILQCAPLVINEGYCCTAECLCIRHDLTLAWLWWASSDPPVYIIVYHHCSIYDTVVDHALMYTVGSHPRTWLHCPRRQLMDTSHSTALHGCTG